MERESIGSGSWTQSTAFGTFHQPASLCRLHGNDDRFAFGLAVYRAVEKQKRVLYAFVAMLMV